jgi:arylsulfatase A-like enzyme/uncharacterized membrane protein YbhN (UPF0104 family)
MTRKRLFFIAKLVLSLGIVATLYWKIIGRQGAAELLGHLANVSFGWIAFGFVMQLLAVGCSVLRWQKLLHGQGIHAPLRHLLGSFMIGRFFGEFAPGGWTGLNGYRIYDIAKHTGKLARATACIGIEMVIGWLSFGAVVIGGSFYGVRFIGLTGVLLVDAFFLGLIMTALVLVSRPALFRILAGRLPPSIGNKLRTTVDAVCAYEGKGKLVTQAVLLGIGTHFFRAFIYVAAARALKADLSVGEIFFGSSLQVFATLMPASVNGIGLREATAVALYTRGGVPASVALLIPTLGFLIEMALSSIGGIVFLARRVGYEVAIRVDHAEREDVVHSALPSVPPAQWPRPGRGLALGAGAGIVAGLWLGSVEAVVILIGSKAGPDYGVLRYGALAYALVFAGVGALLGFSSAWSGRLMRREAVAEPAAFARGAALLLAAAGFGIAAFRVRRDYFLEQLAWKSPKGLAVLLGCAALALIVYALVALSLRLFSARPAGGWLLRAWGPPLLLACALAAFSGWSALHPAADGGKPEAARATAPAPAPAKAGHILLIVVDTLRADHLPSYGYSAGKTPNLERFAADAIRFDAAFVNASWTRPSFASILSGRYAASHRTMAKSDALPDEIVTLPEALRTGGYQTLGVVTNYNVAPFFNFHQGFDVYRYLEPNFVLGANDTAAKLLLVQFLRQRIETVRARSGQVEVGSAYQDAPAVNRALLELLPQPASAPLFVFAAYMDPHDPYYPHPYDGTAYSRAAHPNPEPEEAPALRRLYDGEITYWDEHFGALIAALKQRGLYDEMTIVITSDHGEEFQDHGGYWHGTTLYDEALRVPLFVKLPGNQQHGSVVHHFVQSIDLMPTLLALADLPNPTGVQGQHLFVGHDSVFAEESHEGNVLRSLRVARAGTTLKLITANPQNPRGLAPVELYRVDQDAREQVDLAADQPEVVTLTHKELESAAKNAELGRATQRRVDLANDANAAARLRALGYAGGDKPE